MKTRLAFGALALSGAALLAVAAADWLFYQSFVTSLFFR
jgi:hypothetical protein